MRTQMGTRGAARGSGTKVKNTSRTAAIATIAASWFFATIAVTLALGGCQHAQAPARPVATSVAGHVYVTNNGDGTVSEFNRMNDGSLIFQRVVRAGAVDGPTGIAVSPSNRFVYVANEGDNRLYEFRIHRHDGSLVPIGTGSISTGNASRPQHIAISPNGRFLYVSNAGGNKDVAGSIAEYAIDESTGALTQLGIFRDEAVERPFGIVAGRSGKFVYVSDQAAGKILSFAVEPSGTLKLVANTPSLGGKPGKPALLAIGPGASFLYAVDRPSAAVAVFKIAADGKLDFQKSYPIGEATGQPLGIALVAADGREFAYTTNPAIGTVSYFVVKHGMMSLVDQTPSGLGGPTGLAVDPGGRFLYVVDQNAATVAEFDILRSHHGIAVLRATIFSEDPANQSTHPLYIAMTH
jgi:DNA-binding beta-propeller fold protein YncE